MANNEIDSFVRKFKVLCQAGRSATLTLSSDAGNASLNLQVDLGSLHDDGLRLHQHPHNHARNGPARQRRTEKRAAARKAEAEQAEAALTEEEKEVLDMAERAASKSPVHEALKPEEGSKEAEDEKDVAVEKSSNKSTQTSAKEVVDEVCPNSEYEFKSLDDFKAKPEPPKVSAKHPKPPPVRDRSLG